MISDAARRELQLYSCNVTDDNGGDYWSRIKPHLQTIATGGRLPVALSNELLDEQESAKYWVHTLRVHGFDRDNGVDEEVDWEAILVDDEAVLDELTILEFRGNADAAQFILDYLVPS